MTQYLRRIPYYASVAFLAYMPLHIFLSQSLSLLTGGLDVWKLAKDALLVLVTVFAICLVWWRRSGTRPFYVLLGLAALYGLLHLIVWAMHPHIFRDSALLGIIYNIRVPCFALLGMSAVLLWPGGINRRALLMVVLGISSLVSVLGIIQYFLPSDILTHVGYSIARGVRPAFLIDDQSGFVRVMSTLREPNALGSYLIVPITLLTALLARVKAADRRMILGGLLGIHGLALLLTFSRSAWLGALLSVALVLGMVLTRQLGTLAKRFGWIAAVLVVAAGLGLYGARHTTFVQTYVTHTNSRETVQDLDSNDYHRVFVERGLHGIAKDPLGHGPGTAGLASIQNPKGSFLTENYYIQIGYELGVLGLVLFVLIQGYIYVMLWKQRAGLLPAVLLASFWAYVLTNMLLHTWSNEAVAAQWWILAGIAAAIHQTGKNAKRPDA